MCVSVSVSKHAYTHTTAILTVKTLCKTLENMNAKHCSTFHSSVHVYFRGTDDSPCAWLICVVVVSVWQVNELNAKREDNEDPYIHTDTTITFSSNNRAKNSITI